MHNKLEKNFIIIERNEKLTIGIKQGTVHCIYAGENILIVKISSIRDD